MLPRTCAFSVLTFISVLLNEPAVAQQLAPLLPLLELNACQSSVHPRLPENWRGIFLMAPFTNAQLVHSEIQYDTSVPAMRVRLYGLRGDTLELFFEGTESYEVMIRPR